MLIHDFDTQIPRRSQYIQPRTLRHKFYLQCAKYSIHHHHHHRHQNLPNLLLSLRDGDHRAVGTSFRYSFLVKLDPYIFYTVQQPLVS